SASFPQYGALPALHSFPTRRSSDLPEDLAAAPDHVTVAGLTPPEEPVAVDDERRAIGHVPFLVPHAVRAHHRPMDVAQERERKRSEEHTSELQSRGHLVCRLLLEKK